MKKARLSENYLFILYKYEAPAGWVSEAQTVIYCMFSVTVSIK